ncbi:acyltransferase family protein [Plesiomonas shigelloides]|uniref:acyltransferase family protein n=1 Tax=Plesiomonas shigelloides TaxID=703 RepID=UPI0015A5B0E7|nr:acyltransferase [Plesiomonas shigelloides]
MSNKKIFDFIHTLRGVAVLLVLWSHLGGWWLSFNGYESILQRTWESFVVKPFHLYQNGGHLGVLVFFLISGFIITHVSLSESRQQFVVKRVFRIFPPLAVSMVITYSVVSIFTYYDMRLPLGMGVHGFHEYIQSLFLINYLTGAPAVNGVTWTLFIEVLFYVITAIFISKTKRCAEGSTYLMIVVSAVLVCLSSINQYTSALANFTVYVFYLLIGRIVYFYSSKTLSASKSVVLMFVSGSLYVFFYEYLYPGMLFSAPAPAYPVIYSDVIAIGIFLVALNVIHKAGALSVFLANTSYSSYLLHLPLGGGALVILDKFGFSFEISFVIALMFCLFVSYLMFVVIEVPSQKLARKVLMGDRNIFFRYQ